MDDHALVRGGLRRLLDDDPLIDVVGELDDGAGAVEAVTALAPTVVILDYVMPGADGIVTLRRILDAHPSAAVLMLSMRDDERLVREALAAGATGFVVKDAMRSVSTTPCVAPPTARSSSVPAWRRSRTAPPPRSG